MERIVFYTVLLHKGEWRRLMEVDESGSRYMKANRDGCKWMKVNARLMEVDEGGWKGKYKGQYEQMNMKVNLS